MGVTELLSHGRGRMQFQESGRSPWFLALVHPLMEISYPVNLADRFFGFHGTEAT